MEHRPDWNKKFTGRQSERPVYDLWLDKYAHLLELSRYQPILDLGCGLGNDSLYLTERGYTVIGCDISEEAIAVLRAQVPGATGLVLDMLEGLPFEEGVFQVVLADLCLHFFPWQDTVRIIADICRVLQPGGVLLCRVNSLGDLHLGDDRGRLLEENYYDLSGTAKRFFTREQLTELFRDWEVLAMSEQMMARYKSPKLLWELALKKPVV